MCRIDRSGRLDQAAGEMNGSRSNTPGYSGRSSLDQLNRTIEGLEARIQGLVGERGSAPSRSAHAVAANPVDEILERQRMLGARDRVSAAMERSPRHEPELRAQPQDIRRPAEPARAMPRQQAAIDDIAATLSALRAELKQGVGGDRLVQELGEIRNDMRNIKSATVHSQGGGDVVRAELARLGDSIDRLGRGGRLDGADALRADLDDLRAMTAGLAREDSLRRLEDRWERTETMLDALDPEALKEELVQLAWRIEDIKSGLGAMSAAPAVRALEDKLITLAGSIETLGRSMEAQGDVSGHFAWLERRLDEISRAIAASASQSSAAADSAAFQRLESRIGELTAHVDLLQVNAPEAGLAERIEALTSRVEELANEDAAQRLEERIGQLSKLIERNFRDGAPSPEYSSHLADISRKIDGLNSPADALLDRLEQLSQRLDEFELPAEGPRAQPGDTAALSRLETRLADIAARLDESVAAPAADAGALRNLEQQVASLSMLLGQPGVAPASVQPDAFAGRMTAIEDYLASSDEFIVEAARQAAEAVVEAYSRANIGAGVHSADISAIAGLAEDLRALEAHTRSSEERTADTFSALHETLVQIASRLDDIGERPVEASIRKMPDAEPQPATVMAPAPRMPRAEPLEFGPVEVAADPPVPRPVPRNSKVDVLQDVEMLVAAADADIAAAVAAEAPTAGGAAKPAAKSLIAGLAAKLLPTKKDKAPARVAVDPTPSLDAAAMLVADETDGDRMMEPGSGVPDVRKIMEKVRAGQKAGTGAGKPVAGQSDVIAAARRAAQAAAQEAGSQKFTQPAANARPGKVADKQAKSIFSGAGESRRPILLAAAAVLLVVMSYPLVSNLIGGRHASQTVSQVRSLDVQAAKPANHDAGKAATPVSQNKADAKPASKSVETGAEKLLAPALDAGDAKPLQKPATSMLDKQAAVPVSKAMAPDKSATAQPADADADALPQPAAADPSAVDTKAIPQTAAELPAGLQPAALAEAARKGDPLAYFEIGSRFTDGRAGMKVDLATAAKWYRLAADKGAAPAQYRLASFYEKGTGVARDLGRAKALYEAAAAQGNASAMHNLAVLYATGATGNPDFNVAAHWFEQAADYNIRDSQFNLAILYARGSGVKQDLSESYKWFGIAARQGDQDAAQKRDEVANAMSPEQLKTAKAKLDLWKPKDLSDSANNPMVPDAWLAKSNTTASVDMKRAIRNIQAILNNNGFDAGKPDGELGKKTVVAIKAFQKTVGLEPNGHIDDALVKELLKRNKKPA
jgi:localization factor PodJL